MQKLPRWAEKYFSLQCSEIGAICTSPDEDISGWDFLVEFRSAAFAGPADSAPVNRKAYVQVKSTITKKPTCKIKISNLLHACHSLDPWFIVLIAKCHGNDKVERYCLHVWDKIMYSAMKAGRKNYALNRQNHKHFLTIDFPENSKIDGNIASWIDQEIGPDLVEYMHRKDNIRKELGYEHGAGTATLILEGQTEDDIIQTFLGLDGPVPLVSFSYTPERFGIPESERRVVGGSGKVSVFPSSVASCKVILRGSSIDRPVSLTGAVYELSMPGKNTFEQLIRYAAEPLEVLWSDNRTPRAKILLKPKERYPIHVLKNYTRIRKWLKEGRVHFDIFVDSERMLEGSFEMNIIGNAEQINLLALITEKLNELSEWSSEKEASTSLSEIASSMPNVGYFAQLLSNANLKIEFDADDHGQPISSIIYKCSTKVGEWFFGTIVMRKIVSATQNNLRRTAIFSRPEFIRYYVCIDSDDKMAKSIDEEYRNISECYKDLIGLINLGDLIEFVKNSRIN